MRYLIRYFQLGRDMPWLRPKGNMDMREVYQRRGQLAKSYESSSAIGFVWTKNYEHTTQRSSGREHLMNIVVTSSAKQGLECLRNVSLNRTTTTQLNTLKALVNRVEQMSAEVPGSHISAPSMPSELLMPTPSGSAQPHDCSPLRYLARPCKIALYCTCCEC